MESNKDITILMLTLNKLPKGWQDYYKKNLLEAIGDAPVITISKEPMDWGLNVIQTEEPGVSNIYWQMLKGAKLANTPYVAIAEDDTLYPKEHFQFRPPLDSFAYNMNRWSLFTWGRPFYSHRRRASNSVAILPRELAIESLEERFKRYPNGLPERKAGELGRYFIERMLHVKHRGYMEFNTENPVVNFNHDFAIDPLERSHRKAPWPEQCLELPLWGDAEALRKHFV